MKASFTRSSRDHLHLQIPRATLGHRGGIRGGEQIEEHPTASQDLAKGISERSNEREREHEVHRERDPEDDESMSHRP
jgi:hypothetical protein